MLVDVWYVYGLMCECVCEKMCMHFNCSVLYFSVLKVYHICMKYFLKLSKKNHTILLTSQKIAYLVHRRRSFKDQ